MKKEKICIKCGELIHRGDIPNRYTVLTDYSIGRNTPLKKQTIYFCFSCTEDLKRDIELSLIKKEYSDNDTKRRYDYLNKDYCQWENFRG